MTPRAAQHGLTLIELVLAIGIASLIFAALNSLVELGFRARTAGTAANEQVYAASFALERVVSRTRAAPIKPLIGAPVDNTGDWLAPIMFCRQTGVARLVETTVTDDTCAGGAVLAEGVTAFSAQLAPSTRPADTPVIAISLTVESASTPQPITVTARARLGGGTL